jgi:hypothetical protein
MQLAPARNFEDFDLVAIHVDGALTRFAGHVAQTRPPDRPSLHG